VSHTVDTVFLIGVPIAAVAFLLSWLLPEVPLRPTIQSGDPAKGMAMPSGRSSLAEIQLALERVSARENRPEVYRVLAERARLDLSPAACWLLYRLADHRECTLAAVAARAKVAVTRIEPGKASLEESGLIAESPEAGPAGPALELTPAGHEAVEKLAAARRAGLTELLDGWDPEEHPEIIEMVRRLARALMVDDEKLVADIRSGAGVG
jgi:DNA-binding MarR family transcriptional regulator